MAKKSDTFANFHLSGEELRQLVQEDQVHFSRYASSASLKKVHFFSNLKKVIFSQI